MSSHKALTGVHNYAEFKEETIANRVKKMVDYREGVDVENAHVKFSYGNRKTGNLVPSVSLIPIADCCSNCACCAKGCYAVRNICCYDAARKMLANNSAILRSDPGKYWREVEGEVMRNRWFRFHVSGDIVDYSYFVNMVGIAVRNPHCEILAFTKNFSVVNEFIDYAVAPKRCRRICTSSSANGAVWMCRIRTTCPHRGRYGRASLCRAASGAVETAPHVPLKTKAAGA